MHEDAGAVQWLENKSGERLGVQTVSRGERRFVRLQFPDGTERLISAESAPAAIAKLLTGVSFSDITGSDGFTVSPEDF